MKKAKLIFLAGLAMAVSLTGCQKKEVKPGDVAGYDEGRTVSFNLGPQY